MHWSKYSSLEKWKIFLSICKGSTSAMSIAMHTHDINLIKKIIQVEENFLKEIPIYDLIYHGTVKYEKYYPFFKVLADKINQVNNEDLAVIPILELILNGTYRDLYNSMYSTNSDSIIDNNTTQTPMYAEEETLGYYIRTKEQNSSANSKILEAEAVDRERINLNYAKLDSEYYQESLDYYYHYKNIRSVLGNDNIT